MLLAFKRDGEYLTPGVLNLQNKLDGEGPFRVVPPQKNPGPPDQRSTASKPTDPTVWVWPYNNANDHNAGFSSRTVTMIKVEPLPEGTTDINTLEAGWPYVEEKKILIYGAINSLLAPSDPQNIVASDSFLYGDFGSDGIWKYDGAWSRITTGTHSKTENMVGP